MPKFHTLRIKEIRREAPGCVSVAFDVPEEARGEYLFQAGQYLTLRTELNGEDIRRSYSICSSPGENELRVAIKQLPGGTFSTFANERLKEGTTLEVMTPMGNFHTPIHPDHCKNYVAFAVGSGITPVISLMKAILEGEPQSVFTLFYGNRTTESILFREALEGLKNRYLNRLGLFHILSREDQGSDLLSGRIDEAKCATIFSRLINPAEVDECFLCGPEAMIHSIREQLASLGVDRKRIHFELFTTGLSTERRQKPVWQGEGPAIQSSVTIRLDGNTFRFGMPSHGETLLEAALKAGADLPFACKGGVCCTCKAKLLEGAADMEVNYALEPDELEAGYILACQAHPKTATLIIDFDS